MVLWRWPRTTARNGSFQEITKYRREPMRYHRFPDYTLNLLCILYIPKLVEKDQLISWSSSHKQKNVLPRMDQDSHCSERNAAFRIGDWFFTGYKLMPWSGNKLSGVVLRRKPSLLQRRSMLPWCSSLAKKARLKAHNNQCQHLKQLLRYSMVLSSSGINEAGVWACLCKPFLIRPGSYLLLASNLVSNSKMWN